VRCYYKFTHIDRTGPNLDPSVVLSRAQEIGIYLCDDDCQGCAGAIEAGHVVRLTVQEEALYRLSGIIKD